MKTNEEPINEEQNLIHKLKKDIENKEKQLKKQQEIIAELKENSDAQKIQIRSLQNIIDSLTIQQEAVRANCSRLETSWSYRIGKAITAPAAIIAEKYRNIKDSELIKSSILFDSDWYLQKYRDVKKSKKDPALHYVQFGWKEGRNPSQAFDTKKYLDMVPEAGISETCPLVHYIKHRDSVNNTMIWQLKFIEERGINKKQIKQAIDAFKETGISSEDRGSQHKITISLTSYPARLKDIKYGIFSLMNQTVKPDRIVLWLGKDKFPNGDQNLPDDIKKLQQHGLTVKYTKDLCAYTKLIPSLHEYPDDIIVTADDDIYYDADWLEQLLNEHKNNKDCVIAHRAHKISFSDRNLASYNEWEHEINGPSESAFNFLTGVGGVLYPPGIFHKDILKEDIFMKLSPKNDDIWFWGMLVLNGKKIRVPENNKANLKYVNPESELGLNEIPTLQAQNCGQNRNDVFLKNMTDYYPDIIKILKEENK